MTSDAIIIHPIGIIHTPHTDTRDMPIQPLAAEGIKGHIELFSEYVQGMTDLEGFSHITLLYHLHKMEDYKLMVVPFMDDVEHGIFATRSPRRPNAMGISTVKLVHIDYNIIHIEMVDMLDETPLIDIKPFFPKLDNRPDAKAGWLDAKTSFSPTNLRSDDRFSE